MFLNCSFSYSVSLGERKGMKGRGKVPNELAWKNEEAFDTEAGDRNPSRGNAMSVKTNQGGAWAPVGRNLVCGILTVGPSCLKW